MGSIFARLLKRLGASPAGARGPAQDYNGFRIQAAPLREGSLWLTAGLITKQIGDETKEHRFIRADTHASREDAEAFSLTKARLIIDEQGERIFEQ